MRLRSISFVVLFFFMFVFYSKPVQSTDLIDLLPGLYGGDGVQLQAVRGAGITHNPHFATASLTQLKKLANAANELAPPVPSSQGGFTLEFDPITNEFVQSTNSLGPIFAERAETIGKNKINLGFVYSYLNFTKFEGESLSNISRSLSHKNVGGPGIDVCIGGPPGACYFYEADKVVLDLDIGLTTHIFSFFGTYGITEKLDIGLFIPIMRNRLSVKSQGSIVENSTRVFFSGSDFHSFDPSGIDGDAPNDSAEGTKIGIGDIRLRSKYHIMEKSNIKISAALEIRIPNGNEDNLMGTAGVGVKPLMIFSTNIPVWGGALGPHLNVGYEINAGAQRQNEIDYIVGFDYGRKFFDDLVTIAVDLIGSHETTKRDGIGDDTVDLATGFRWNFYKKHLVSSNLQFPLNKNDGLKPDVTFTIGYEIAF